METPLDVLSRAAAMLQPHDTHTDENAVKRAMEGRESPPKELPTKMLKYQRMRERRISPPTGMIDQLKIDQSSRKCAGTQTSFSSLPRENYPPSYGSPVESSYQLLDLDKLKSNTRDSSAAQRVSPPPVNFARHRSLTTPPPLSLLNANPNLKRSHSNSTPPYAIPGNHSSDNAVPLNLSVSASNGSSSAGTSPVAVTGQTRIRTVSYTFQPSRPTVIAVAPSATPNPKVINIAPSSPNSKFASNGFHVNEHSSSSHSHSENSMDDICDPAIEEHFRRSLGSHYAAAFRASTTPSPPRSPVQMSPVPRQPASPPQHGAEVSMTTTEITDDPNIVGAVDDHFAKSLGDTWLQIKAKAEAAQVQADTVDDHFAKALGHTWFQIKADNAGRSSSCSPHSHSPRSAAISCSSRSQSPHSSSTMVS